MLLAHLFKAIIMVIFNKLSLVVTVNYATNFFDVNSFNVSLSSIIDGKGTKSIKLIASGGISTFDELPKLAKLGCEGTIIGKAIYENRITLKQLEQFILTTKI